LGNRPAAAGRRGGEPHGAAGPAALRRRTIRRASCRTDRAQRNVAPAPNDLRVSCIRTLGGNSRPDVGYELPLPEGICHAFIPAVAIRDKVL
jgi:hypothetical protein